MVWVWKQLSEIMQRLQVGFGRVMSRMNLANETVLFGEHKLSVAAKIGEFITI